MPLRAGVDVSARRLRSRIHANKANEWLDTQRLRARAAAKLWPIPLLIAPLLDASNRDTHGTVLVLTQTNPYVSLLPIDPIGLPMIEIATYLRDAAGGFVNAEEASFSPPNPNHIEGAIHLRINGVDILDQSMWDDVDQLWCYIANMIDGLETTGYAHTYFPDQPIELSFKRLRRRTVLVRSVGRDVRGSTIDEDQLVSALKKAALDFFARISLLASLGCPEPITRLK